MKLRTITNKKGEIIAILPVKSPLPKGKDAPAGVEPVLLPGQALHDVEVPPKHANLKPHEIIQRFRVQRGKLVEVKSGRKQKK